MYWFFTSIDIFVYFSKFTINQIHIFIRYLQSILYPWGFQLILIALTNYYNIDIFTYQYLFTL
jgi:hypothetical protein